MINQPATPYELPEAMAERRNAGDLTGLAALYERAAMLVPETGMPVRRAGLYDALAADISAGVPMELETRVVLTVDGIALIVTDWMVSGVDRKGTVISLSGRSADIARRSGTGDDCCWRYLIDNPYGVATPDNVSSRPS